MRFKLRMIASVCAAMILSLLPACRRASPPAARFVSAEFGIELEAPEGWRRATPSFSSTTFCQYDAPANDAALYVGVNIDPLALFGGRDGGFLGFVQHITEVYSTFMVFTNTPAELNGEEAMRFTGLLDGNPVAGACLRKGADEYFVILNAWGHAPAQACAMLEPVLQSIRITGTQTSRREAQKIMATITTLPSMDAAREALRFGRQLMAARNADIKNYSRAIDYFLAALIYMRKINPPPQEYAPALQELMLIRNFRATKMRDLRVILEQALALRERAEAMRAADNIMKLYPDTESQPYRYAVKRWKAAAALPIPGADAP